VLLDGLYPNGLILELGRRYHWQFMIVFEEGSLPSVWKEVTGFSPLHPDNVGEYYSDQQSKSSFRGSAKVVQV